MDKRRFPAWLKWVSYCGFASALIGLAVFLGGLPLGLLGLLIFVFAIMLQLGLVPDA